MITFTFYGFLKVAEQSSNSQKDAAVNNAAVVAAVDDAFGEITQKIPAVEYTIGKQDIFKI